jgi:hypothetical protein
MVRVSRDSDSAALTRMLVLPMASADCNQVPAILLKHPKHLPYLHGSVGDSA